MSSPLNDSPGRIAQLLDRAFEIKAMLDAQKPLYEEMDAITNELAAGLPAGTAIEELTRVLKVVDNFADRNTVFRPAAVRRFELQLMSREEFEYSKLSKNEKAALTRAKNKAIKLEEGE